MQVVVKLAGMVNDFGEQFNSSCLFSVFRIFYVCAFCLVSTIFPTNTFIKHYPYGQQASRLLYLFYSNSR